MRRTMTALVVLASLPACSSEPAPEPVSREAARADTVAVAAAAFDPAVFDTITWESDQAALDRGSLVFRVSCAKCHGQSGRGNGGFVLQGDTLRPPSFLSADWRFADDMDGLRRQIFTGNVVGMPYWGLVGLQYRDLDAVARFITEYLRATYSEG